MRYERFLSSSPGSLDDREPSPAHRMGDAEAALSLLPFQVSAHEPGPAAGPCPPAGLQAKLSVLRGSGPSPGDNGLGGPWRGVLQVCLAPLTHDCPSPRRVLCHGRLCRYGEHSTPFPVSMVNGCRRGDGEFSRRIHDAVERASLEVRSGSSSDEDEEGSGADSSVSTGGASLCAASVQPTDPEPKTIPTVSNPNSVYRVGWILSVGNAKVGFLQSCDSSSQFTEFSPGAPQTWLREKRKVFAGDPFPPHAPLAGGPSSQFVNQKSFNPFRTTFTFTGPRVDKYHWVSKSRS